MYNADKCKKNGKCCNAPYYCSIKTEIHRLIHTIHTIHAEGEQKYEQFPKTFSDIVKFNPYHGPDGRFTGPGAATSFTYKPGKGKMYDNAIARERERTKASAAGGEFGLDREQHEKLERLVNSSVFAASAYRKEIGMSDEDFDKYKAKYKTKERRDELAAERRAKERQEQRQRDAETSERIKNELPGLDQNAIRRADDNSMMGSTGKVLAKEALGQVDSFKEQFKPKDDWTDEQKQYAIDRQKEYTDLVTQVYNDQLNRSANNVSWMVAGPANYNTRAFERKQNAQMNAWNEGKAKMERFKENTERGIKERTPLDTEIARWRAGKWSRGESISADDPNARAKLQAKLDYMKEYQENMKAANRAARGTGTKPHPSWELSNNNQQIKATESRLKQLEQQQARAAQARSSGGSGSAGGKTFTGGRMVHNTDINRLQLVFDGKPSAEVRAQLKANGFRWSPREGAWQRQDTPNAERAANSVIEGLNKSFPATPHTFHDALHIQSSIEKKENQHVLFIGLHLVGVPEDILIDGGEEEDDLHVTLVYGYFTTQSDNEYTTSRVQAAIDKVRPLIPEKIQFDRIGRFEASEGSDGKDVIYARVSPGQLEKAHQALIRELKRAGIKVEETFPDYNPHMTLAYIDSGEEFELSRIRASASIDKFLIGTGANADDSKDNTWEIVKTDSDKRLVFGWANVAIRKNGQQIKDWQNDMVDPEDLEEAAYKYVLNFRNAGEEHIPALRKKARMVESVVFTEEKLKAMGIPSGIVPLGWWIGFYVDDDDAWEKIKNGTYKMFSIEGSGAREAIDI